MSRVGKKPIIIPDQAEIKIDGSTVLVKGPKGEISKTFRPEIKIELKEGKVFVFPAEGTEDNKKVKAFWGLTRMLLNNMIEGVVEGFEKKLEISGVGYKSEVSGKEIILNVGFSHPVKIEIPEGLEVSVQKNIIVVSGIDKELVGHFASIIRRIKPAEPYKGKGIKYFGEKIRRKVGKKAASGK